MVTFRRLRKCGKQERRDPIHPTQPPHTCLFQPNVTPGNCWAFAGDRGQVTIRLAQKVYLSNITLQHIPKTISLSGSLDTAPKDFVIYVSTQ